MIYGYVRVSTGMQTVENQRFEIERFCAGERLVVDEWVEETVSGTKAPDKRKLGGLLDRADKGDLIVCSELSRLGRSLFMIMDVLSCCMDKGVRVWTIKDGYRLGDDIQSKVLAFAFGLSAEIERNLISQRTKEALARRRAEGVRLGRPVGSLSARTKLSDYEDDIRAMLGQGRTKADIARKYHVHPATVGRFVRNHMQACAPQGVME
ncbi:invertase [Bifidobacterium rousetti]|uniref:master DNA invertase Mpi family serine-type recombinase n=1 Tax=Bifidobacterium rousetti TaxID=2045439 RepID=UPI00123B432A|nr:master DNA invertase Mpi family serine-type recombinase [Bifidobacterium rousetti]KAA8819520.1 invertase [Bifidobacterium rousetti]